MWITQKVDASEELEALRSRVEKLGVICNIGKPNNANTLVAYLQRINVLNDAASTATIHMGTVNQGRCLELTYDEFIDYVESMSKFAEEVKEAIREVKEIQGVTE